MSHMQPKRKCREHKKQADIRVKGHFACQQQMRVVKKRENSAFFLRLAL